MPLKRFIKSAKVQSVSPTEPIHICAHIMRETDVGALPVVEEGKTVGIITDRDLVMRAMAEGRSSEDHVETFMTSPPVTISDDANVDELIHLMEKEQVRRVVVEDDGTAVGIVSSGDIEELLSKQFAKIVNATCPSSGKLVDRHIA